MNLDFTELEELSKKAVSDFWESKRKSETKSLGHGQINQEEDGIPTDRDNMDGFKELLKEVAVASGLPRSSVITDSDLTILPGRGFDSIWDLLVEHDDTCLAALRIRNLVGPFSDEENPGLCITRALGAATNFHRSIQDGQFNMHPRPFLGFLVLLADDKGSPHTAREPSPDFNNSFYREDFENSCRILVQDGIYDSTALLFSSRERGLKGEFSEFDSAIGLKSFLAELHIHLQWRLNIMALG